MVNLAYLEKCFTLNLMTVPSSHGEESAVISVQSSWVPSDGKNKTRARANDRSGIPNDWAPCSVSLKDSGSCTVTGSWNLTSLLHWILNIGPANISLFLNSLLRNSCIYKWWSKKKFFLTVKVTASVWSLVRYFSSCDSGKKLLQARRLLFTLYWNFLRCQFTISIQLIKTKITLLHPPKQHHHFFRTLPPSYRKLVDECRGWKRNNE